MQIFVRPINSPGEVFAILIGVGHPPVFGKNLFLQVGDPKDFHQGYHEMTYTKFGRGRSFCKNEVGGGGEGPGGLNSCFQKKPAKSSNVQISIGVGACKAQRAEFLR